jgi:hypothetical protein
LKWHKEGCYAVAFAAVGVEQDGSQESNQEGDTALVPRLMTLTVKEKRIRKAEMTHWLAAGSKDGKVSLWDIY